LQNNKYQNRRQAVYSWLVEEKLDAVLIEDTEGRRNSSLRYLCGMPSDALLLLTAAGKSILVPWDINLAEQFAEAEDIVPYSDFERRIETAVVQLAEKKLPKAPRIELSSATPVPVFHKIKKQFSGDIFCRDGGIDRFLDDLRAVKDHEEIAVYRKAAEITDTLLQAAADIAAGGEEISEIDIAFLIEMKARQLGAEGTGFATLAAGPDRSFAIHPFPNYSGGGWGTPGLSILDFGVSLDGYTTDVTCTVAKGSLSNKQREMIALVQEVHDAVISEIRPGVTTIDIARKADALFSTGGGYTMPHSLGHGIGLAAHEAPILRSREDSAAEFLPGMIFTIEPGLYDPESGGVRLENDFLITDTGVEQLTNSRIYTFP
jgi:Xaa-Pro dipeptidase